MIPHMQGINDIKVGFNDFLHHEDSMGLIFVSKFELDKFRREDLVVDTFLRNLKMFLPHIILQIYKSNFVPS